MKKKDKYDRAIEYLTEHPEDIVVAWGIPGRHTSEPVRQAHCLFELVRKSGSGSGYRRSCGCLTEIRYGDKVALRNGRADHDLTLAIRQDTRLPGNAGSIRVRDLPVFAEWQRRLDKELGR